MSDEQEKAKIQNDLAILTKRLAHLNEKLSRQVRFVAPRDRTPRCGILPTELRASVCVRVCVCLTRRPRRALFATTPSTTFPSLLHDAQIASRNEYDRTIQETEAAYSKILESSQTLLTVLKRETVNIAKKRQASS